MQTLRFHTASSEWVEGVPVGCGNMGYMVYGLPGKESICFNADTLFRSSIHKELHTASIIPKLRELVLNNRGVTADKLFRESLSDQPQRCNSFQPFFVLETAALSPVEGSSYVREICLNEGTADIKYDGIRWDFFASCPDQLLVLKRSNLLKDSIQLKITRPEDEECSYHAKWDGEEGIFLGKFPEGKVFAAYLTVITDGVCTAKNETLVIKEATSVEIRVSLETKYDRGSSDVRNNLQNADTLSWKELKRRHVQDYRSLFDRMTFSLGEDERDTDELYNAALEGEQIPPAFCAQLFAFARYLTICSSRPGNMPINLQGLWNQSVHPAWASGYTTDMNVEMVYWMTEAANLSECHMPLFDWLDSHISTMNKLGEDIFGAKDAAYIPQFTDSELVPTCDAPYAAFQVLWTGAAPWLASHYVKHWKYTGDDTFARERAYPFCKRCMNLYLHLLTEDKNGRLILAPSTNPENWAADGGLLVNTTTMDIALIRELTENLIDMCESLKIEDSLIEKWKWVQEKIIDYPIDETGLLKEWHDSREPLDPSHRHLSHLYGLFPSHLFDGDEVLTKAALKALDKRTANGYMNSATWSFAWYACLFARLGKGECAEEFVGHLIRGGLLPNLLTVHNDWRPGSNYCHMVSEKLFQIDALLGYGAAVCEMLICEKEGIVYLLPSLPDSWKKEGRVQGICLAEGIELSFSWKNGEITELIAVSAIEKVVTVCHPNGTKQNLMTTKRYIV